jgi:hypothetical protein
VTRRWLDDDRRTFRPMRPSLSFWGGSALIHGTDPASHRSGMWVDEAPQTGPLAGRSAEELQLVPERSRSGSTKETFISAMSFATLVGSTCCKSGDLTPQAGGLLGCVRPPAMALRGLFEACNSLLRGSNPFRCVRLVSVGS